MNFFKSYKTVLFLLCAISMPLLSLIDLRNRHKSVSGESIRIPINDSNDNTADNLKLRYDFIITQTDIGSGGELVLTTPGRYILESDMTYTYSYALAIADDRIKLDLAHKQLKGQGLAEGGVLILNGVTAPVTKSKKQDGLVYRPGGANLANMHYITIKNGKIDDVLGIGINAFATERLKIKDVQVTNADQGFCFNRCEDIELINPGARYITNEGFYFTGCVQIRGRRLLAVECNHGASIKGGLDGSSGGGTGADLQNCYICGITEDAIRIENCDGIKIIDVYTSVNGRAAHVMNTKNIVIDRLQSVQTTTDSVVFNAVTNGVFSNSDIRANADGTWAVILMNGTTGVNLANISAGPTS